MTTRAIHRCALCAIVAALGPAAAASAQSTPGDTVYNPNGQVLNVVSGGGHDDNGGPPSGVADQVTRTPAASAPAVRRESGTTAAAQATGSLPFTGFQAALVAGAGLALLAAGVVMRRLARHDA